MAGRGAGERRGGASRSGKESGAARRAWVRLASALLCGWLSAPPRLLACDAMLTAEYREPPEWVEMPLDRTVWDVASRARTPLFARKEYVPSDETLHDWTELVTWTANFGPDRFKPDEAQDGLLRGLRVECDTFQSRVIRSEPTDRVFEWWHDGCRGRAPQHEVVRMIAGTVASHIVTYGRKGSALGDAEREHWVSWISALKMGQRMPLAGDLSAFDQAQVLVWKGEYEKAVAALKPLLDAGDPRAQELYGKLFVEGWGVSQDYAVAREWFEKAEQGSPAAAYDLGLLYENGWGVAANPAEAYRRYRSGAERGDMEAQGRAGFLLAQGVATARDPGEAYRWFESAAAQGHDHARYWLGKLTAEGAVGEPDLGAAQRWYDEAARAGELEAQYELGVLCAGGQVKSCGERAAKKWLLRATMQGHEQAREFYLKRFGRLDSPGGSAGE